MIKKETYVRLSVFDPIDAGSSLSFTYPNCHSIAFEGGKVIGYHHSPDRSPITFGVLCTIDGVVVLKVPDKGSFVHFSRWTVELSILRG